MIGWISGLITAIPAINTPLVKLDNKAILAIVELAKGKGWLPASVSISDVAIDTVREHLLSVGYHGSLKELVTRDWRFLVANALGLVNEGESVKTLPSESLAHCSNCGLANFGFLDNGFVCRSCGTANA